MNKELHFIMKNYNVPAKTGTKVVMYSGKENEKRGKIIGAAHGYLKVKFEGDDQVRLLHPQWEIKYESVTPT
jgi:hypothetical protein